MTRVYVASSWKNTRLLDETIAALRRQGHEVYDFRETNPPSAFNWSQIDPTWDQFNPVLSASDQQLALKSDEAERAYGSDKGGLDWCETGVLLLPCGRSAHLEAGYLLGKGKPVHVLLADDERPELMYLMVGRNRIHCHIATLLQALHDEEYARETGLFVR